MLWKQIFKEAYFWYIMIFSYINTQTWYTSEKCKNKNCKCTHDVRVKKYDIKHDTKWCKTMLI